MRFSWGLLALAVVLPACGGKDPSRLTLQTPGANTGHPMTSFPFVNPTPTPTPKAEATPKPEGGTFTLTERPGKKCDGPGNLAEVAFLIRGHHIQQWVRAPDPEPVPTPTPKP